MSCDCASNHARLVLMSVGEGKDEADIEAIKWAITTITKLLGDSIMQKELLRRAGTKISAVPFIKGVTEEQLEETGINKLLEEIWAALDSPKKESEDAY